MASHHALMFPRRDFLSAALLGLTRKSGRPIQGGFVNESAAAGHRLRDTQFTPAPRRTEKVSVVIIGGGMAGLSAAWRLRRKGFRDFVLLEMAPEAGGNSRWGENEITRFPWGAHYLPVPGKRLRLVRELMEELGILQGDTWQERWLCHSPQERVFVHGRWQEGFEPEIRADREEWRRFEARMEEFAGKGDFTIPVPDRSTLASLDRVSMREWLRAEGFRSPYLQWYVDYACRDDFGAYSSDTSAWMGIHYFASRAHEERGPLTWPEGNGWILQRLLDPVRAHVRCHQPVVHVGRAGNRLQVWTPDTLFSTDAVVYAAPTFLARYLVEGATVPPIHYSPWVTANLTLDRLPAETGSSRAWDNVIVDSPSLGYVVATHMNLASFTERSVWTWYHALPDPNDRAARERLLHSDWQTWRDFILRDLSRAHPDIEDCVSRIDVMRFGHAMARPVPGSVFGNRATPPTAGPGIFFANSDVSGYSIFEEAQFRGVSAADAALRRIGSRR